MIKIQSKVSSNTILIFWNIIVITFYVVWESWVALSPSYPFNPKIQIPFYALVILYYLFASYVYLPYIFRKFESAITRIFFIISLTALYTYLYAAFNSTLHSILINHWDFDISEADLKRSSNRSVIVMGASVGVWMARYIIMNLKKTAEYKFQKLEAEKRSVALENAFLRAQLGPHLMFNSLSSIYNKVVTQAPEAPDTIELLTKLLDYSLANNKEGDTVTLAADLENMKNSIRLNELTSSGSAYINYSEELDDPDVLIAPLIMQGFVDNIFKHGDLSDFSSPAEIRVTVKEKKLHFCAKNKITPTPSLLKRGIGLANSKQRLSILYPNSHRLSAIEGITHFEVDLIIFL